MAVRELRISDTELQKLIATAIRKRLKAAGFTTGTRSDDSNAFFFPINLDLAGDCTVTRLETEEWVFTQEESSVVADRMAQVSLYYAAAIALREGRV